MAVASPTYPHTKLPPHQRYLPCTHSLTYSCSHTHLLTQCTQLTHTITPSPTHSLAYAFPHLLTPSLPIPPPTLTTVTTLHPSPHHARVCEFIRQRYTTWRVRSVAETRHEFADTLRMYLVCTIIIGLVCRGLQLLCDIVPYLSYLPSSHLSLPFSLPLCHSRTHATSTRIFRSKLCIRDRWWNRW